MKKEYVRDIGWGIFFFLLALFIWIVAPYQIPVPRQITAMGPRFFPKFVSLLLGLVSLGLVLTTWRKHRKETLGAAIKQENDQPGSIPVEDQAKKELFKGELRAIGVLVLMVIYTISMPLVGFIISSIVIGSAILFILSGKTWYYYLILIAAIFLIYYVFKFQLYVQLP